MLFLERNDGQMIFEDKQWLEETKTFYENLYCHRDAEDVDLNEAIHNIPTLRQQDKEKVEGLITYTEIKAAPSKMKNNESRIWWVYCGICFKCFV